ncbi:MAG: thiamine-phosphate kinase [Tidjanibacter sp.]|nr:thiamine-phosphate kinase [Tidjanibacter sp.]
MNKKGEFGFIEVIKSRFGVPEGVVGIGDDCAIVPPCGEDLLVTTDMLVEGIHFLRDKASPEDVGYRSAAVNLSDVAAMGGEPVATFLSIALPRDAQGAWAERFVEGYAEMCNRFGVPLLGGDTTSAPQHVAVNVAVLGRAPRGEALRRDGARVGDTIYVTGCLGDSGGGLKVLLESRPDTPDTQYLVERHHRPTPRLREGTVLRKTGCVGAMMDISDGIASDLRHILEASGVGAVVDLDRLPTSPQLRRACEAYGWDLCRLAAAAGEDFELLLTGPANLPEMVDFDLWPIGTITQQQELTWRLDGEPIDFTAKGFAHF